MLDVLVNEPLPVSDGMIMVFIVMYKLDYIAYAFITLWDHSTVKL
jgi:hypothetical protein